jgi:uncharacterized protein YjiS (DUF1127 family)
MSTKASPVSDGVFALPGFRHAPGRATALASLSALIAESIAAYRQYRAFRRGHDQLMALDDRMLRDIGLDRTEISSALLNAGNERWRGDAHQR